MNKKGFLIITSFVFLSFGTQAQNISQTVCQGNLARLDSLLSDTTSINILDGRGRSLLHHAVNCKQEEVFNFLIDRGINSKVQDKRGQTPLTLAMQSKNETYFNSLIDLHEKEDLAGKYGASLLEEAVLSNNLNFAKKLTAKEVELDLENTRGNTPLAIALREGLNEIVDHLISLGADQGKARSIELKGKYLGQKKPSLTPELFAPNFISTEYSEISAFLHPNGNEFYYTIAKYGTLTIMVSKLEGGKWSKPQPLRDADGMGPVVTKDGLKLYFGSIELINENDSRTEPNLWVMERDGDSWADPKPLSSEVNTPDGGEWFPSIADDGTLYFKRSNFMEGVEKIYYTESKNGRYQKPKLLEAAFNLKYNVEDPFMAPDKSYVIFNPGGPDLFGPMHISFRDDEGNWSAPKNMGLNGSMPSLSPDRKYLFFVRNEDIYWVDAQVIETLR